MDKDKDEIKEIVAKSPNGVICKLSSEECDGGMTSLKGNVSGIEGQEGLFHSPAELFPSRKRELSLSTDQCPSGRRIRSMPNPAFIDASVAVPASHGMLNNQAPNALMMENAEVVPNANLVKTIGLHLSATETLGKHFDQYIKDSWSFLMDGYVFRIGIHGVGGVGKTEVAKHINNLLLQNPNKFHHVFWVNASPHLSIPNTCRVRGLQTSISKAVGIHLSEEDDVNNRAAQLSKGLTRLKKSVMILDDVWDYTSLEEVGIPVGVDQCTVLLTTRSLEVCRAFCYQTKIEIGCLPPDEGYELFKKILGSETTLSREVEGISSLVADKCAGLPLAITIMARKMKGVTDTCKWRDALTGYTRKKADMEVFQKLKMSYDYLKDEALQQCFLYSLLLVRQDGDRFIEYGVRKRRLVQYIVDEGIIKGMSSRREELAEAHAMLDFLGDVGLLEITSYDLVKMNELIWGTALQIMEENEQRVIIKKSMSLKDLPDEESWTEDLGRVSLEDNEIEKISSNYSPSCPKLSTLLLSGNDKLGDIGNSFFEGMHGLKLLDLSFTSIKSLPSSVCRLVNLTTLLLSFCRELRDIPSVAKLQALKKLDLKFSGVEEVPEGIEMLSKLTYLDLSYTEVELKSKILTKFSHLQVLGLPWSSPVKVEILARLSRLESLTCSFYDVVELNRYLTHLKRFKDREAPMQLHVQVGQGPVFPVGQGFICYTGFATSLFVEEERGGSVVGLYNCKIKESAMWNYFRDIVIVKCNEARSLCNFSPIKGAGELKHFSLRECDGLEFLCSLSLTGGGVFEKIECMELVCLENLSVLLRKEGNLAYGSCFSNLTRFAIKGCPSMKRLFPIHLMPNLRKLRRLYVEDCPLMEEIFGAEEEESKMVENKYVCGLPELSTFWLVGLPELKRVCCGCGGLFVVSRNCYMNIEGCPNIQSGDVHRLFGRSVSQISLTPNEVA